MKCLLIIIALLFTFNFSYPQQDSIHSIRQIQLLTIKVDSLQKRFDSLVKNSESITQTSVTLQRQQEVFNNTSDKFITYMEIFLGILTFLIPIIFGIISYITFKNEKEYIDRILNEERNKIKEDRDELAIELAASRKLNEEMNSKLDERFKKFLAEQEAKEKERKFNEINEAVPYLLSLDPEEQWQAFMTLNQNRRYTYNEDQLYIMVDFYRKLLNNEISLANQQRVEDVKRFFDNLINDVNNEKLIKRLFKYHYEHKATGKDGDQFVLTFVNKKNPL